MDKAKHRTAVVQLQVQLHQRFCLGKLASAHGCKCPSAGIHTSAISLRSFASARARQLGVEVKDDPFNERRGVLARPGLDGPLSAAAPASTAVRELEPESAAVILNEEVRESFVLTGTAFAGAGVLEAVGTSILPTTLEDLLVTAVAGVVAYLAVLNLPLRRAETKAKVQRVSANFSKEVNEAMEYELEVCLNDTTQTILTLIEPLIKAAREEVAKVIARNAMPCCRCASGRRFSHSAMDVMSM